MITFGVEESDEGGHHYISILCFFFSMLSLCNHKI